jgi:hypothetical protein
VTVVLEENEVNFGVAAKQDDNYARSNKYTDFQFQTVTITEHQWKERKGQDDADQKLLAEQETQR